MLTSLRRFWIDQGGTIDAERELLLGYIGNRMVALVFSLFTFYEIQLMDYVK